MPTKIEWTEETWNPVTGCTKVSEGCRNCYAERMARRLAGRYGYPEAPKHFDVTLHRDKLMQPTQWRKPRMIFVCSMGDLFHPLIHWDVIEFVFMAMVNKARHHTYQVLTKRPARMQEFVSRCFPGLVECSPHIWLGVTAENQRAADERIPLLLQTPARVRFVSCEPLLEEIHLDEYLGWCDPVPPYSRWEDTVNWVIVGGESGPGARPMHPDWARSLRDQCQAASVPFFFKQWGEWKWYEGPPITALYNQGTGFYKMGKKATGRLLDGREWNEMPRGGDGT